MEIETNDRRMMREKKARRRRKRAYSKSEVHTKGEGTNHREQRH